ncbi:hypothetical protein [Bacteroides sp. An51A]|uniref:hypothetical protein n=1 Tax=Bacteroides sp. An51A TaxID=1965640 RepID=UPI00117792A5|nr:hypothetical protein [Bacteroides sp. An51A]
MANRGLKINTLRGLFVLSLLGITACVDDAYDLSKDVDMTITVGGENLSIPGSNTDSITLAKIFDLDPESDVKADANGDYALTMNGEGSQSTVNVESVIIEGDQINTEASTTELNFQYVPNQNADATVDDYTSFNINKTDVTTDVVELYHSDVTSTASLDLTFSGSVRQLNLAQGFKVTFPSYMTIHCSDSHFQIVDNTLTFADDVAIPNNGRLSIPLSVSAIDFETMGKGEGLVERGHLVINGEIPVEGRAYLRSEDFLSHQDVQLNLYTELNIDDIELTEVTAMVDPQIDITINPVQVNNLPEFLQDDEVHIDMTDPKIYLYVTNESPVAVNFTADMKPYKDGQQLNTVLLGDKEGGTEPIVIPANQTDYVICLHRLSDNSGIDADEIITVPNLNDLIETIPDEIRVENINAKAEQERVTMQLGRDYAVETNYDVVASLQFNNGTEIVYSDQMDGWNSDMQDLDARHAEISLDATNTIPLNMEMTANAIDRNGNVMDEITATVEGTINAGTSAAPSVSTLTIRLESNADGALKEMDGIAYRVKATVPTEMAGTVLNEKQTLLLDNVVVTVKGGVTVDLN